MIKILTSSLTLMPTGEAGLHSGPINIYSHLSFSLHIIIACIIIVNFMITIFSAWMELSNTGAYFLLCRIPRAMLRFICEQGTFCWFWVAHEKCLWSRQVRKIRNCPLLFVCFVSATFVIFQRNYFVIWKQLGLYKVSLQVLYQRCFTENLEFVKLGF